MKYLKICILILFLSSASLAYATALSLNQSRFVPGDNLVLTLTENWSGEADVYIAVSLSTVDTLFFFTPPDFVPDFVPFVEVARASGSREILQSVLPAGLPTGEYTFYAAAMRTRSFFDMVLDIASTSFIFANVVGLSVGEHGTYKGCNGLQMAFNSVQDLNEIRIEQGTYECNGLLIPESKSFEHGIKISGGWDSRFENQSDDPAVTILDGKEKGRILSVSADMKVDIEGLSFQNGYGGDGGAISGNGEVSITNCIFTNNRAYFSYGGAVFGAGTITNSTFTNNGARFGGAVSDTNTITNSTFNNRANFDGMISAVSDAGTITKSALTNVLVFYNGYGGAVHNVSTITNSTFTNNKADNSGGAVHNVGTITNSTFTNNSAFYGGAVYDVGALINSTFTNNSVSDFLYLPGSGAGGAVYSSYSTITNSTFTNNSASENGGAYYGGGTILNSIFAQNKVGEEANDITPTGDLHVDYTLVNYVSGAVK
jgi:hypothetical protein